MARLDIGKFHNFTQFWVSPSKEIPAVVFLLHLPQLRRRLLPEELQGVALVGRGETHVPALDGQPSLGNGLGESIGPLRDSLQLGIRGQV